MNKQFYGWVNVVSAFIITLLTLGLFNSTSSLFIKPVSESLGIPRSAFGATLSIVGLAVMIISLFYGRINRYVKTKRLIVIGVISAVGGIGAYSIAGSITVFYISAFFIGTGLAFTTTISLSIIINNWFIERKGLVLGIIFSAGGVGGMIFNPIVGRLIETIGWRYIYMGIASIILFLAFPAALLIAEHPSEKKQKALGADKIPDSDHHEAQSDGISFQGAIKSLSFYLTALMVFCMSITIPMISQSIPSYLTDISFSTGFASTIMAVIFSINAVSNIVMGSVNDRFGIRVVITLLGVAFVGGTLLLINGANNPVVIASGVLIGIAMAIMTVPLPLLVSFLFGHKAYGSILGILMAVLALGAALGFPLGNLSYDLFETYIPAFILAIILMAVTLVSGLLAIQFKPKEEAYQTEFFHTDQ